MEAKLITLEVGDTRLETANPNLVRQVLEQTCGLGGQFVEAFLDVMTPHSVPPLGAVWPGEGGVNAGLVRGDGGTRDYYLIVPTGDDAEFEDLAYGGRGAEIEGAGSAWDGLANTRALLASGLDCPAANAAAGFTRDGHNDYYLPARRELQVAEANVSEVFSKVWHWSSTQYSADYAYTMGFSVGSQSIHDKGGEARVRPVRRKFL
ncbi:hypothetical protein D3C84_375930 [compost metagenome]